MLRIDLERGFVRLAGAIGSSEVLGEHLAELEQHGETPWSFGEELRLFLEEVGLAYKLIPINIGKGEQFQPEFLRLAPNNRIPAIVDHDPAGGGEPIALFESGEILLYLAEKTGLLLPSDLRGRHQTLQWLFWQMITQGTLNTAAKFMAL